MVSVIIPTYNRARTLKQAAVSVLNQTYLDLELIIVDDCSTDRTEGLVKEIHDERIGYICHSENQGACAARNTGIQLAKGEYIAFQDSDDVWRPEKLMLQMDALQKYKADVCFCKFMRHNYSRHVECIYPNLPQGIISYDQLLMDSLVSTQTIVAKRKVFERHQFDISILRMQDYDWVIRAGQNNRFVFLDKVLVDLYLQKDSITVSGHAKTLASYETFLKKYTSLFTQYPQFHAKVLASIGYCKVVTGKDGRIDYTAAYEAHKNAKAYIKMLLARMGMLKLYYKMRNRE